MSPATTEGGAPSAVRQRFLRRLPFPLDPFQLEALDALDEGSSVLVSAPTGSGKTLVAEYGVERALGVGGKAFYTTPLKALSNQKFAELAAIHGAEQVGLLTGDTAVRPEAPVVVMTTEVLRNMLLAGSPLLAGLRTVVLDEVHYLQDPYRGGVWEEVLVLCPATVTFVCLSATVSNAQELGAWLTSVRGPTVVVVERRRPVVLRHHLAVHRRTPDGAGPPGTDLLPLVAEGRPGGEAMRIDQSARRIAQLQPAPRWRGAHNHRPRLPFRTPRRTELIEALEDRDLLPTIVFIFSRAACDDAVAQCLRDGLRLTDHHQRAEIRRIAEQHVEPLSDDALTVLAFPEWVEGLSAGVAAHHAGLVPAYREAVEECFAAGLLQVVFATETLSLGINMPARTVAIERFDKYGSAGRATLTSGEYAQLTGRAGRRGLDNEGHAVVLWSPDTAVSDMARVAVATPPDLHSAFRPTYNLAVNLVRRFDRPTALSVLRRSFAQWQADAAVRRRREEGAPPAGSESGRARRRGLVQRDVLVDHLGRRLAVLEELGYVLDWRLTPQGHQLARVYHEADLLVAEVLADDVLVGSEPSVLAGVLSSLVFERRRARQPVGPGSGRRGSSAGTGRRRTQGSTARRGAPDGTARRGAPDGTARRGAPDGTARRGAPDGTARRGAPDGTARRGAPDGTARRGAPDGTARRGAPGGVAAVGRAASSPGTGSRDGTPARAGARGGGQGDRLGDRRRRELADRLVRVDDLAERIRVVEEIHLVPRTREPEHGLAGAVTAWARGAPLGLVLDVAAHDVGEVAPGDFVRTVKQLVDLVGQVATVAPSPSVAAAADEAVRLLRRDVVAAGGAPDRTE